MTIAAPARALAEKIAPHLTGWRLDKRYNDDDDDGEIRLLWPRFFNPCGAEFSIILYDRDKMARITGYGAEIKVSPTRSAPTLANDIHKRLIPAVIAKHAEKVGYQQSRKALIDRIAIETQAIERLGFRKYTHGARNSERSFVNTGDCEIHSDYSNTYQLNLKNLTIEEIHTALVAVNRLTIGAIK